VDETVDALRAKGLQVSGVVCHVGNAQQRAHLIKQTVQEFGQLDILISNAAVRSHSSMHSWCSLRVHVQEQHSQGTLLTRLLLLAQVNPAAGPLASTPPDAIDKILDINVKAALLLVQEALPHMKRGGRIVLISSVTAFQ
jgi:dehydrogenase/reductase SDR family protein 4